MHDILAVFGVNWKLLIAQAVNFGIVLLVLHHFVYRPLLGYLERRQEEIGTGLLNAEKAHKELEDAATRREDILRQSRTEAKNIVDSAAKSGEETKEGIVKEATARGKDIIVAASREADEERRRALESAKGEVATLAFAAVERILRTKITPEEERRLIEQALEKHA